MTFVVTEACINCKHTDCVEVCPVDAIYADSEVPAGMEKYAQLNAELSRQWPPIVRRADPLPQADHWATVKDKLPLLKGA